MDPSAAEEPTEAVQRLLEKVQELDVLPLRQYGPEQAREMYANIGPAVDGPAVGGVENRSIPGYENGPDVSARIYRPASVDGDGRPTIVFYHGGGFVIGDPDTHDVVCRHVTTETESVVVSVDYRLAPEHPFPAAVQDAYAALEWAADPETPGDEDRLVVMGDSAGGNLATVASLMARDLDGPDIGHQVLFYPTTSRRDDWESIERFGTGYFLEATDMEWFHDAYIQDPIHQANPYANPMEAKDLSGLPSATVITAGYDPLRDEGAAYAAALDDAGVPVTYRNYDDVIHGFVNMIEGVAELDAAAEALEAVADDLDRTFGT